MRLYLISVAKLAAVSLIIAIAMMIVAPRVHAAGPSEQRGTPEQERACRPDVIRHCRGISDTFAIEHCLRANMQVLRPACRQVFGGG